MVLLAGCGLDPSGLATDESSFTDDAADGAAGDAQQIDGFAADTAIDDTAVIDTSIVDTADTARADSADGAVTDTSIVDTADTAVADSSVADTADTAVADTSVADTSVADTALADTSPADTADAADTAVDTGSPCTLPAIAKSVSDQGITVSSVSLAGGGNVATVKASSAVSLSFAYQLSEGSCSGCIDQIEIGWAPGSRVYCAYDANPPGTAAGTSTHSLTAPATPGLYELRFNLGQNYSCTYGGASSWWGGAPPGTRTFGAICVVP